MDWRKAEGIQRPAVMCENCPRRTLPTRWETLLRRLGLLPLETLDADCLGGEEFVTTVVTDCDAESCDRFRVVTELDCPRAYPMSATDWNIYFLHSAMCE